MLVFHARAGDCGKEILSKWYSQLPMTAPWTKQKAGRCDLWPPEHETSACSPSFLYGSPEIGSSQKEVGAFLSQGGPNWPVASSKLDILPMWAALCSLRSVPQVDFAENMVAVGGETRHKTLHDWHSCFSRGIPCGNSGI